MPAISHTRTGPEATCLVLVSDMHTWDLVPFGLGLCSEARCTLELTSELSGSREPLELSRSSSSSGKSSIILIKLRSSNNNQHPIAPMATTNRKSKALEHAGNSRLDFPSTVVMLS